MFSILNRALSWAITSYRNKFNLRKRSRLIKGLHNRFYVKFLQLEIGLLITILLIQRDGIVHLLIVKEGLVAFVRTSKVVRLGRNKCSYVCPQTCLDVVCPQPWT